MLDHSIPKYGSGFVEDVKSVIAISYMFLPLPFFWSLYDQQGSRWTFQATRMNGETFGYQILPDQMQVINPILIMAFIVFMDYLLYPFFGKLHIQVLTEKS